MLLLFDSFLIVYLIGETPKGNEGILQCPLLNHNVSVIVKSFSRQRLYRSIQGIMPQLINISIDQLAEHSEAGGALREVPAE